MLEMERDAAVFDKVFTSEEIMNKECLDRVEQARCGATVLVLLTGQLQGSSGACAGAVAGRKLVELMLAAFLQDQQEPVRDTVRVSVAKFWCQGRIEQLSAGSLLRERRRT